METAVEPSQLAKVFSHALKQLRLPESTPQVFEGHRHSLVLCSGSKVLLKELIVMIRDYAPDCRITVVAPRHVGDDFHAFQKSGVEVLTQSCHGRLVWSQIHDLLPPSSIDRLTAIFNTVWGTDYDNVREICRHLNIDQWYAYNCHRRFLQLDTKAIDRQQKALEDMEQMANCIWSKLKSNK
jgi:hypothetical protein